MLGLQGLYLYHSLHVFSQLYDIDYLSLYVRKVIRDLTAERGQLVRSELEVVAAHLIAELFMRELYLARFGLRQGERVLWVTHQLYYYNDSRVNWRDLLRNHHKSALLPADDAPGSLQEDLRRLAGVS